ncbi:MAG: OmpA family protein [Flavobacteriales bacterium]|nr:OmpA family protein [Flavobacteriales bacterium]
MGQQRNGDAYDNKIRHGASSVACKPSNSQIHEYTLGFVFVVFLANIFPLYSKNTTPHICVEFFYVEKNSLKDTDSTIFIHLNQNINSPWDDYDPMISADSSTFVFTSTRMLKNKKNENIYISTLNNGSFDSAKSISKYINTPANEGSPFLSYDGKTLYFSSCGGKKNNLGLCDIFYCELTEKGFSRPKNMGRPICTEYWDAHPSVSPDGCFMYFSSSRHGGKGGKDIWVSEKKNGIWITPQPISEINTPMDEVSPFIHADGKTLYFSSSGHNTYGRLDFFMTKKDSNGKWSTPQNLGNEINNENEQYSLRVDRSGRYGFFATDSFPDSYGGLDIYMFALPDDVIAKNMNIISIAIKTIENTPIYNAQIYIRADDEKNEDPVVNITEKGLSVIAISGVKYKISAVSKGFLPHFSAISTNENGGNVSYDIILEKITENAVIDMSDVHFATDVYSLDSVSALQVKNMAVFLLENEDLYAEISGHTDNTGDKEYNAILSEKRANSVADALVSYGVEKERISTRGYGDTIPISSNNTDDGKSKNRRTEIRVFHQKSN